jgi:hypothetical protein
MLVNVLNIMVGFRQLNQIACSKFKPHFEKKSLVLVFPFLLSDSFKKLLKIGAIE